MAERTATIQFDEAPDIFVVRITPVALDDWLDIDGRLRSFRDREQMLELIDRFCEVGFVGWTSDPDDATKLTKEEPTAANLRRRDTQVILALIHQWSKAIAEAPLPLPRRPASGGPSRAQRRSRNRRS